MTTRNEKNCRVQYEKGGKNESSRGTNSKEAVETPKEKAKQNAGGEEHRKEEALSNDDSGDTDNGDEAAK